MISLRKDEFLWEDLEYIANSEQIPWGEFRKSTILVTGATGLIGSLIVKSILLRNQKFDEKNKSSCFCSLCGKSVKGVSGY